MQILILLLLVLSQTPEVQTPEDNQPNGFDVSTSNIDKTKIIKGGPSRDGIPAIDTPTFVSADQASWLEETDMVVGFVSEGNARAYPIRVLQYHECVNDTVGDQHIAVTYCPLCQSSFVFERKFGDEVYDFGTSGMLWNSNVLLYDRQTESLWSQTAMRAVTGAAAKKNLSLKLLPSMLVSWSEWLILHPDTSVLSKETGHDRDYDVVHYAKYFELSNIWFDVDDHLDNPRKFALKDNMLLVQIGKQQRLYSISELIQAAGDSGVVKDTVDDQAVVIRVDAKHGTASVREWPSATMYWFAASACLPNAVLWNPPTASATPQEHPTEHPTDHPK